MDEKSISKVCDDRSAGLENNQSGQSNVATSRDMPPGPNCPAMENPGKKPDAII